MKSKPFVAKWFRIYNAPNTLENDRLGVIVSKKISNNSVNRNFLKRIIREEFRSSIRSNKQFSDIVVQLTRYPFGLEVKAFKADLKYFLIKNAQRHDKIDEKNSNFFN